MYHLQEQHSSSYITALRLLMMLVQNPSQAQCAAQIVSETTWMSLAITWWQCLHLTRHKHIGHTLPHQPVQYAPKLHNLIGTLI